MFKTAILAVLLAASTMAHAADYAVTADAPLHASVQYGFDDTVSFTPSSGGNYNVDVVPTVIFGGCSTRYCHSKWSIVTTITAAYVSAVNLLPNGNATVPMTAGTTYVLHVSGVGTGTGIYVGRGAYTVSVAQQ